MACIKSRFLDVVLAASIVLVTDFVLFHLGLYVRWLAPRSYAGAFELSFRRREGLRRIHAGLPEVLLLGNSTMASAANEVEVERTLQSSGHGVIVTNVAGSGAGARTWYVQLQSLSLAPGETRLVVLGVHAVLYEPATNRDLETTKARLRADHLLLFARHAGSLEEGLTVASAAVLRMPLFRDDVQNLLTFPGSRLRALAVRRDEEEQLVSGLLRPSNRSQREIPPVYRLLPDERPEPSPDFLAFLERTIAQVNARGVPVLVAAVPRSPFRRRCRGTEDVARLVAEMQARGARVEFYEDDVLLETLERPESFADPFHLNARGASLYSAALGARIGVVLDEAS